MLVLELPDSSYDGHLLVNDDIMDMVHRFLFICDMKSLSAVCRGTYRCVHSFTIWSRGTREVIERAKRNKRHGSRHEKHLRSALACGKDEGLSPLDCYRNISLCKWALDWWSGCYVKDLVLVMRTSTSNPIRTYWNEPVMPEDLARRCKVCRRGVKCKRHAGVVTGRGPRPVMY